MFFDEAPGPAAEPTASAAEDDARFAMACTTRSLDNMPPMLPVPELDSIIQSLRSILRAKQPRESLVVRTLRRAMSCAVHDNDAIARLSPFLHDLSASTHVGNGSAVAAGLLLLFAHGAGQLSPPVEDGGASGEGGKPLVLMLGFAGGTPSDLRQYSSRLFGDGAVDVLALTASEIPEVYQRNIEVGLARARLASRWFIQLFSKAGFLMLARLLRSLDLARTRAARRAGGAAEAAPSLEPPFGIIWDSSPGSFSNYGEFVAGTWQSAELVAKRGKFVYSAEARARMDELLHSPPYAPSVRTSYGPIASLQIHPCEGACHGLSLPSYMPETCHHVFLFSDADPVCSADEIRTYISSLASACDPAGGASCKSVRVRGTHCDGLFADGAKYTAAVKDLLARPA
jgi:hypothetical protein